MVNFWGSLVNLRPKGKISKNSQKKGYGSTPTSANDIPNQIKVDRERQESDRCFNNLPDYSGLIDRKVDEEMGGVSYT